MFRLASKPLKLLSASSKCRCFCVESQPNAAKVLDTNRVVLCGTVVGEKTHEKSEKKVILLRTTDRDSNTPSIHTVNTSLEGVDINVKVGQRYLCKGQLFPHRFTTSDDRQRIHIIPGSYLTKQVHENGSDMNFVELNGFIASNVLQRDYKTLFWMVSHCRMKSTGELFPYFFHMQVNDYIAPQMVLKLEKRHRIYVTGKLQYEPVYGTNGERKLASSISVDRLCKGRISDKASSSIDASVFEQEL